MATRSKTTIVGSVHIQVSVGQSQFSLIPVVNFKIQKSIQVVILVCLIFVLFSVITYQFDISKHGHFACSSFDHKVVSTRPRGAGVYICGPGMSTHGVFGNKSFTVEEKARFVLTLTYQEHDFDVHDSKVENKLVFEFGFTLNTIEDYLYQKENMWAISGYKCHNIYNVCLILTYPSQLNVNIHQSLWLGYEDSVFTKKYNSGTVMGRLTLVLNRKARTLSILTKSRTFHFDLIDDKQVNGNVWPVFLIHEIKGVFPLSAKIGENSRFSYDPSSLPPTYFLSEDNNTVSHIDSTKTKYVNKKNRYVYTMPENFQPNVKYLYSRFRIVFKRNQAVTVGQKLFEFGFGIVQNKRFKSLMKTKCKTYLTSDGANIGFYLENSLASATKQTFYEYVDLKWDIFVYFDFNANELNVFTLPCDTCSYYHQTVSLDSKIYYKPHKFYFGRYNATMMMVVSNLAMTQANVHSMHINIFKEKIAKMYWS